jgi:phosphoglucosamine mutase
LVEGRRVSFGTDGVRGVANAGLRPEDALALGLAAARAFGGPLVMGRDTRLSGGMLSCALASGAASGGARVLDLGMLPTPGRGCPRAASRGGRRRGGERLAQPLPRQRHKVPLWGRRKLPDARERELERLTGEDFVRPTGSDVGAVKQSRTPLGSMRRPCSRA